MLNFFHLFHLQNTLISPLSMLLFGQKYYFFRTQQRRNSTTELTLKIIRQKSHNFWTKLTKIGHSVEAVRAHAQCSARIWRLYTSLLVQTAQCESRGHVDLQMFGGVPARPSIRCIVPRAFARSGWAQCTIHTQKYLVQFFANITYFISKL